MSKEGQDSRRDHLTATTPEGKIELTEEELGRAVGGGAHKGKLFQDSVAGDLSATVKFKFTTTT